MSDENLALVEINKAQKALDNADDISDMLDLRDKAMAFQLFANARGAIDVGQKAKVFQLKCERKAGDWLAENVDHRGGNPQLRQDGSVGLLPEGIDEHESARWQQEAKVPEEVFNIWVNECLMEGKEITASELQKISEGKPHVSNNSGNNEWNTPQEYIDAARQVLGEIDLDPASNEIANKIIKAKKYFTAKDDGLKYSWEGRIWMNPPYAIELIRKFSDKLLAHYKSGDVIEAIILVNNSTETQWFYNFVSVASSIVFTRGRVKFWKSNGDIGAPLQGQAIIYLGKNSELFLESFAKFGWGCVL